MNDSFINSMRIRLRLKSSLLYKSRYLHKVINIYTLEKMLIKIFRRCCSLLPIQSFNK